MNIAVFCGSSVPKEADIRTQACRLGKLIASQGHRLVYGGSNLGLMGDVSGAALAEGGCVEGVIPTLFSEEIILSQSVTELRRVRSMAERKEYILKRSDVFIALPGGIGTLDEVSEVMVSNQLGQMQKPLIIVNINGFYNPFLSLLEQMQTMGLYRGLQTVFVASDADECMSIVNKIYGASSEQK